MSETVGNRTAGEDDPTTTAYDVVVVGGGAAGLSGALALGRSRRRVLVVDAGAPRNAPAGQVHNFLGNEGTPPEKLLATGRAEVAAYGVRVVDGEVVTARRLPDAAGHGAARFRVELADGRSVSSRRLLVTTGLLDELPDLPGLAERWGCDVLHCPYCHGWEVRDRAIGVLATGPAAVHQALLFRQLSQDVVLFAQTGPTDDGPVLTGEQVEELTARDIRIVSDEVTGLDVHDDRLRGVRLRSGEVVARDTLVVSPRFTARAALLAGLGLTTSEFRLGDAVLGHHVAADPTGATAVPGVWVAGNVTDPMAQVVTAAAAGLKAGAAINADLVAEETAQAVAAHRARTTPRPAQREEHDATGEEYDAAGVAEFWEGRYRGRNQLFSGRVNPVLAEIVGPLPAGRALDLGCGEGGDAIWLAGLGWQVTAVDLASTALERAAAAAATAGVRDRIDFQRHDLARTFPAGAYDLVSAQFLQSPVEFPRERVLRAAARAVAPGGLLLIVEHGEFPPWARQSPDAHADVRFHTPQETVAALDLTPGEWHAERLDASRRQATGPDGQPGILLDHIVALRRRAGAAVQPASGG